MDKLEKLAYTYKHRKVVQFLGKIYYNNEKLSQQLEKHDLDKMFLMLFYDIEDVHNIHTSMTAHHKNKICKTELDYIEMVLDWESARYTKPDKPLNAYDTLYKFYPEMEKEILPILNKLKIDKPNLPMNQQVVDFCKSLNNVTMQDIKNEMISFIREI